jgi:large subunit ribosomal protein L6
MSRIGRQPVNLPAGVTVQVSGEKLLVQGSQGKLDFTLPAGIQVEVKGSAVHVTCTEGADNGSALHGLVRSRLSGMVEGVTSGFRKDLTIEGTGYNAKLNGKAVELSVGFCNPVLCTPPEGVAVKCTTPTEIAISGPDKIKVGQFAAEVRSVRPPEPYKGKGIRYKGETVRRKAGKSVA